MSQATIPTHSWAGQIQYPDTHLAPKNPTDWIVYELVARPSLNIYFGAPGSKKSMLMMDMMTCVATGTPFLKPEYPDPKVITFPTQQVKCLWADFDQGNILVSRRLEAFEREYGVDASSKMIGSISMPYPPWSAVSAAEVKSLADWLAYEGIGMLFLDALSGISGGKDENSSEMLPIMHNLHYLAERANLAVGLIHHSRKESGVKSRLGEKMRGFSGIEAAIDTAFSIENDGSEYVYVYPAKARSDRLRPFTARFWFEHHPGLDKYGNPIRDLKVARFYGEEPPRSIADLDDIVVEYLEDSAPDKCTVAQIEIHVSSVVTVGKNKLRDTLNKLWLNGDIKKDVGSHNRHLYYV